MGRVIRRLLVANRGEIAVRVMRACQERGIETVAVYSTADEQALHTRVATRAEAIGPAAARDSYLSIGAIVDAARRAGADAVHPGYGFLSENAAFADACLRAGLTFVGPPPDAIARMGSKVEARQLMQRAGVPVVPGDHPGDQHVDGIAHAARTVGLPVLVKASAGGGGKGMRVVREAAELPAAIEAARREAEQAFGDGTLYVERLLDRPRHVEIQILADEHDRTVHLFERDCSVQRRHQKVIEESPSPGLAAPIRERMGEAALAAARAVGYRNAGTVEFLLEGEGHDAAFYFLEMNTRLQVEHPVTELVTGVDLVHAQLAIAAGEPLPWDQRDVWQRGHAIECRIYAEDPRAGFLPQGGVVRRYVEPVGPGIRVDSGIAEGSDVTVHYDPLLAKVIVHAATRDDAMARAASALTRFVVLGLRQNIGFLRRVLAHPAFREGRIDIGFVDREHDTLVDAGPGELRAVAAAAALAVWRGAPTATLRPRADDTRESRRPDPWDLQTSWRA